MDCLGGAEKTWIWAVLIWAALSAVGRLMRWLAQQQQEQQRRQAQPRPGRGAVVPPAGGQESAPAPAGTLAAQETATEYEAELEEMLLRLLSARSSGPEVTEEVVTEEVVEEEVVEEVADDARSQELVDAWRRARARARGEAGGRPDPFGRRLTAEAVKLDLSPAAVRDAVILNALLEPVHFPSPHRRRP